MWMLELWIWVYSTRKVYNPTVTALCCSSRCTRPPGQYLNSTPVCKLKRNEVDGSSTPSAVSNVVIFIPHYPPFILLTFYFLPLHFGGWWEPSFPLTLVSPPNLQSHYVPYKMYTWCSNTMFIPLSNARDSVCDRNWTRYTIKVNCPWICP